MRAWLAQLVVGRDALDSTSSSRASTSNTHAVRRGFVFQDSQGGDNDNDGHDSNRMDVDDAPFTRTSSAKSVGSDTFVFRVKKPAHAVDVSTASAALQSKKERAQKAEERRQRILKQQRDDAQEAAYAKQLENKLTPDQLWLYDIVRTQIKRELRKTNREFAHSSARKDIVHLSTSLLVCLFVCLLVCLLQHGLTMSMLLLLMCPQLR